MGYFWLPDRPDQRVPGRLTFSSTDGGSLSLIGELAGRRTELTRVLGEAEGVGYTLEDCLMSLRSPGTRHFPCDGGVVRYNWSSIASAQRLLQLYGPGMPGQLDGPYHRAWQPGQAWIAAEGGAGRRHAKNAARPMNQSREAHPLRPGRSTPPEGGHGSHGGRVPAVPFQVVADYRRLSAVPAAGRAGDERVLGPQYPGVADNSCTTGVTTRSGGPIPYHDSGVKRCAWTCCTARDSLDVRPETVHKASEEESYRVVVGTPEEPSRPITSSTDTPLSSMTVAQRKSVSQSPT